MTSEMEAAVPSSQLSSPIIKKAIEDLIESGSYQRDRNSKLRIAANELLNLPFHTEGGCLRIIKLLTKLRGCHVVKIIRQGLINIGKVYSISEEFEDESVRLLELCNRQYSKDSMHEKAPLFRIIDWTMEFCKEFTSTPHNSLSNLLVLFADLYEAMWRFEILLPSNKTPSEAFKTCFEVLKPRLHSEAFVDLVAETINIVDAVVKLNMRQLFPTTKKIAPALFSSWIGLLRCTFVSNDFAIRTAKNDLLVLHKDEYAERVCELKSLIYNDSLVYQFAGFFKNLTVSTDQTYKMSYDVKRLEIFFDNSESVLRYADLCLKILESDEIITNQLMKEVFNLLGMKKEQSLSFVPKLFFSFQSCQDHSFMTICQALFSLQDKAQILSILKFWKNHFPEDSKSEALSYISYVVKAVLDTKGDVQRDMGRFLNLLSKLSLELRNTLQDSVSLWCALVKNLIVVFPDTWDSDDNVALINRFAQAVSKSIDSNDSVAKEKLHSFLMFTGSLKVVQGNILMKRFTLRLSLNLMEDILPSTAYEFALNGIIRHIGPPHLPVHRLKKYTLDLLQTIGLEQKRGMYWIKVAGIVLAITNSSAISDKEKVLQSLLELLQRLSSDLINDEFGNVLQICETFFRYPVNNANASRFLAYCSSSRKRDGCQFVCAWLANHQTVFKGDSHVNRHITCLLSITKETCDSGVGNGMRVFFFDTATRHISTQHISSEVLITLLTAISRSLYEGNFDKERDGHAMTIVCERARKQPIDPKDALWLYDEVKRFIVKAESSVKLKCNSFDEASLAYLAEGLRNVVNLPLSLAKIKILMSKVYVLLEKHEFAEGIEILNVMVNMFKLPEENIDINSEALFHHVEEVLMIPSIVTKLASIPVTQETMPATNKVEPSSAPTYSSLFATVVGNIPSSLDDGSSIATFRFVAALAAKFEGQISKLMLPLAATLAENCSSGKQLIDRFKQIDKYVRNIPPHLALLVLECVVELYRIHMTDEHEIQGLISELCSQWKLCYVTEPESKISVAKLLVNCFKSCSSKEEKKRIIGRVIEVVTELDTKLLSGTCLPKDNLTENERVRKLLEYDLYKLVTCTPLESRHVNLALRMYEMASGVNSKALQAFTLDQDTLRSDDDWLTALKDSKPLEILTPGKLAYVVLTQLKRLNDSNDELEACTLDICMQLINNHTLDYGCCQANPIALETYVELFISTMKDASCLEEIQHWLAFSSHHFSQCAKVILECCRWNKGSKSKEEAMKITRTVSATVISLKTKSMDETQPNTSCYTSLDKQLEYMACVLHEISNDEIVERLFQLFNVSPRSANACAEIVASWSKQEAISLLENVENMYKEIEINPVLFDNEVVPIFDPLPLAAKAHLNSANEVIAIWTRLAEAQLNDPVGQQGLQRIQPWREKMISSGFSPNVIDSWCTSLLNLENLNSRDVDTIVNLTPESIQLLIKSSDCIKECLFSKPAPKTWKSASSTIEEIDETEDTQSIKTIMTFARILNEFISIRRQVTENSAAATILHDGVKELCTKFQGNQSPSMFYKVQKDVIKKLFFVIFCQDSDTGQGITEASTLQSLDPLLILLRRLLRSVSSRPVLFGLIKKAVKAYLEFQQDKCSRNVEILHKQILELGPNQDTIERLEESGYNQCKETSTSEEQDLWYSPSFRLSSLLTRYEQTSCELLKRLLRSMWCEWKYVLLQADVNQVKVDGTAANVHDLFKYSDTLEDMEKQAIAAKKAMNGVEQNNWSDVRRRQLMRKERNLRDKIKMFQKTGNETTRTSKLTKLVIVWENRLLDIVKLCSENIPGCYAPNGFHSEKPVICGLSVDNKILTLYKEKNGRTREELEDVEVKLYTTGMLVFALHSSGHLYVTDQLWAAFFKMLLDKGLVPRIFLSNISPAFGWITMFVKPVSTAPSIGGFMDTNTLIPSSEDYYDYDPVEALYVLPEKSEMKELVVLTKANVQEFKFTDLENPSSNYTAQINKQVQRVKRAIKDSRRLFEMHGEEEDVVLKRLHFAIHNAIQKNLDGTTPTEDSIKNDIDMKKLSFKCPEVCKHEKEVYVDIVLDTVKAICGETTSESAGYDPTECVVFSQWSKDR